MTLRSQCFSDLWTQHTLLHLNTNTITHQRHGFAPRLVFQAGFRHRNITFRLFCCIHCAECRLLALIRFRKYYASFEGKR